MIALPLLVPLLVLGIPFLDVLLAIVRRTRKGLGIAHADKEHIFHHLMDIGHGHRGCRAADVPVVGVGLWLGARDRGRSTGDSSPERSSAARWSCSS